MSAESLRPHPRASADLRCPYCHAGDFATEPSLRCEACLAWQHVSCVRDTGVCGSCRVTLATPSTRPSTCQHISYPGVESEGLPWTTVEAPSPGWQKWEDAKGVVASSTVLEHLVDPHTNKSIDGTQVWVDPQTMRLYRTGVSASDKREASKSSAVETEKKSYVILTARGYEIAEDYAGRPTLSGSIDDSGVSSKSW